MLGLNWVFDKLREWVGTVTGKGDRWGRDKLGRSEPAFMAASTTVLPPLTCTASRRHLRLFVFFYFPLYSPLEIRPLTLFNVLFG